MRAQGKPILTVVRGGVDHDKPVLASGRGLALEVFARDVDVDGRVVVQDLALKQIAKLRLVVVGKEDVVQVELGKLPAQAPVKNEGRARSLLG